MTFPAYVTISQLPTGTTVTGAELLETVQNGSSVAIPISLIQSVPGLRVATSTTLVAALVTDVELGIDTRTVSATVNLPSVVTWVAQNKSGIEFCVFDLYGNAGTNNITPALNGADTFLYGGLTPSITANYGTLRLRPVLGIALGTTINSWYVRAID